MMDIVERLNDGVHEDGMHDDNSTSLFDIDDANEIMCEAATEIASLRAERDAKADTIATLQAKLDKAVDGLEWIEKTCREKIPLEYNDGMRKAFQRNIRAIAQSLIKELRP